MGKTIVIIGAGPGVGFAVAQRFGKEGYNVALLARSEEKLDNLVKQLEAQEISVASFYADVLDRNSLKAALSAVKKHFGSIDVIEFSPTPSMETMRTPRNIDVENAAFHLDFQLLSAITVVQAVLPDMLSKKEGSLLFTTASSAQKPTSMTASFGIAAGALLNYIRVLNNDLSAENIFAGIVSIGGLVYNTSEPDQELLKHFPQGMPAISSREVAETHWKMHSEKKENEMILGKTFSF
ncbi:SDR family oxidoreductase [Pedobacter suwonensis]|uniref:SDR family oxidoreductase n=1 Tax=Pedobacter suwonensis TaxID=332999 RepID=UPI00367AFD73